MLYVEFVLAMLRHAMTALMPVVIAKGWADEQTFGELITSVEGLVTAAISFGGLAWSFYRKWSRGETVV